MNTTTKSVKNGSVSVKKNKRGKGRPAIYAFAALRVGKSLVRPLKMANNLVTSAYLFGKRHNMTFKSHRTEKQIIVKRVA